MGNAIGEKDRPFKLLFKNLNQILRAGALGKRLTFSLSGTSSHGAEGTDFEIAV